MADLMAELDSAEEPCPRCRPMPCECPPEEQPEVVRLRRELDRLTAERDALADSLPCEKCDGTGIVPSEYWGRDADGAEYVDEDRPCPDGCPPGSKLRRIQEAFDQLRADRDTMAAAAEEWKQNHDAARAGLVPQIHAARRERDEARELLRAMRQRVLDLAERLDTDGDEPGDGIARLAARKFRAAVDGEPAECKPTAELVTSGVSNASEPAPEQAEGGDDG